MRLSQRLAGLTLCILLTLSPLSAEELRIAPEDLRLRTAVSTLLTPSLRLQLQDMAAGTPLPMEDGVVQTDRLLEDAFADRRWDSDRQALVRYYFLVARMEKSRDFSAEFERRRTVTEQARSLMQAYIGELNRSIARAVFVPDLPVDVGPSKNFPLTSAGWEEDKQGHRTLVVLHRFPEVNSRLGRETLRELRDVAGADLERLEVQLSELDDAERLFLAEIHQVGLALFELRPQVSKLVRLPRAGLPFSF
jgi:hypothetical protein